MFGFDPRQVFRGRPEIAVQGKNRQLAEQEEQRRQRMQDYVGEAPQQAPRWAQALQGVGATLQDVQAARDGRTGTAVDRFSQAQQRMRQARQEHDQRRKRFEQLSRNISPSDTQFWNAFALGGEESAMQVLQSRSEREYDSAVRKDDRAFRRGMAEEDRDFRASQGAADRSFRRSESAADRAFRGREGALDRSTRIYEGNADRDLRRSEGAADRENALLSRMNTALVANARQLHGLRPDEPLTAEARETLAQSIIAQNEGPPGQVAMQLAMNGFGQEEIERYLRGRLTGLAGDDIEAIAGALEGQ